MHFLTVTRAGGRSFRFTLPEKRVRIGRSSGNDLVLGDPSVSRQHAAIRHAEGEAVLEDASRHGTWVNGSLVKTPTWLRRGDSIRLGNTTLYFDAEASSAATIEGGCDVDSAAVLRLPGSSMLTPAPRPSLRASEQATSGVLRLVLAADRALTGDQPFTEMCGSLLDLAAEVARYDRGAVLILRDGDLVPEVSRFPDGSSQPLKLCSTLTGPALKRSEAVLVKDSLLEPGSSPVDSVVRAGIRSAMCVPLVVDGCTLGLLYVDSARAGKGFTREGLDLLGHLAAVGASRLRQSALEEEARGRAVLQRELRRAGEMQARLLPAQAPTVPGYEIHGASEPCMEVGGDGYGYIPLPDGRLGLSLSDVAGKGLSSALLMSGFQATLQIVGEMGLPPAETVSRLNRAGSGRLPSNRFITLFYGVLDPVAHSLTYVNAGQNVPLLLRADGRVERLPPGGMPLGMFDEAVYREGRLEFEPGDLFVCYSDGAVELTGRDGEEFGLERLEQVTCKALGLEPSRVVGRVWKALQQFHDGRPPEDDITFLALRRCGPAARGGGAP